MRLDTNVNFFLGLQSQLKVMHWQTKGYAKHKALDETLDALYDLVDTFVEEAMGKYGRFKLEDDTKTIEIFNLSEIKIKDMIDKVVEALNQYTQQFDEKDTNLLNVRDEMIGLFRKLGYLLTLE
jgi:hypothetical protein